MRRRTRVPNLELRIERRRQELLILKRSLLVGGRENNASAREKSRLRKEEREILDRWQ